MNCPFCNRSMQSGYIPNGDQPVHWIPDGKKPSRFRFSVAEAGVTLINQYAPIKANGYKAEAYYCPVCKYVIAPTE